MADSPAPATEPGSLKIVYCGRQREDTQFVNTWQWRSTLQRNVPAIGAGRYRRIDEGRPLARSAGLWAGLKARTTSESKTQKAEGRVFQTDEDAPQLFFDYSVMDD